jgi:bacterioferritin
VKNSGKRDLIAGLNTDLANEYASVIQYRTFASTVRGPHRMTLRPLFAAEIADELAHAGLLADAIVALGGTPTVSPALFTLANDPAGMLQSVLEAELGAIARYAERRGQAEAAGEHGLAVAIDDFIVDETRHRDELGLVLAGWVEGPADQAAVASDGRQRSARLADVAPRDAASSRASRERERHA